MATKLRDLPAGTVVMIAARIVRQQPGQTILHAPGVGESGQWSSVNSIDVAAYSLPPQAVIEPGILGVGAVTI